jgi:hypothetical protein
LSKRLSAGLTVYGFACAEHGLRYYAIVSPGTAVTAEHIQAARGATLPQDGAALVCDRCAGELGWLGPHVKARSLQVPAEALSAIESIRDDEHARRQAMARKGA